jgi:AraC-like DNA-binding protein
MEASLSGSVMLQPVPARSLPILELMFGDPYGIHRLARGVVERATAATLVGAKTHRVVDLHLQGRIDAFTIAFQPGGLAALFRLPIDELTDEDFDAESVIGRRIAEMYQRLGEVSRLEDRARIADAYLLRALHAADAATGIVRLAATIGRKNGCVQVAELAASTGLGKRQFERRFLREIGIMPKLYTRIVRFEAALRLRSADANRQWVDIAHTLGYHDQMHMVHDFRSLAGASPSAICQHLDMFVKPEVSSGAHDR